MLGVRRAAAKLIFVVVVIAGRVMPPRLLVLMTGLGRVAPSGSRPHPGGTRGPVRIAGREPISVAFEIGSIKTDRSDKPKVKSNFRDLEPRHSPAQQHKEPRELVP